MLQNSILYTALPAKNPKRLQKFFEENLGIKPVGKDSQHVFYETAGAKFFIYYSPSAGTNQATAACFEVNDIESVVSELCSRGVKFERFDNMPGVTRKGDIHISEDGLKDAWFKDTEGNIIAVTQFHNGP